jgi:Icc-related predicted phosphoesterase
MNVQILSDLHLEFHRNKWRDFVESLDPRDVDVLVVAGDISTLPILRHAIASLCAKYAEVVYVLGNHEYYDFSPGDVDDVLASIRDARPNFHWLQNEVVEIAGTRFAGTTLWFRDQPSNLTHEYAMNDFSLILGFKPWVYEQNEQALEFLEKEAPRADVVVTHHMPSVQCVLSRFEGDPTNCFFLCELDDLIQRAKPSLWIHGHTHDSIDVRVGETRVICNPLGYMPWHNQAFDEKLIVEVEPRS